MLVVDDSRFICESTCILLQNLGMKGEWVLSGEEAVARVIEKKHKGEESFCHTFGLEHAGVWEALKLPSDTQTGTV